MADDDLLKKLLNTAKGPWQDAFNLAYIPGVIAQQKQMHHQTRRQNAQVDALLKSRYAKCGQEGAYSPPAEDDEEMSDTYINCPIIGDAAIARIAAAKGHPQQQVRPSKPWWRWLLGLLLTALLIAAIIWLTLQWFGGSDQFELLALPYQPT